MKQAILLVLFIIFLIGVVFLDEATITGKIVSATSGEVSIGIRHRCQIPLQQGWNFVSFCANATNTSVSKILDPIQGEYRFVLLWDEIAQDFVIYSPRSAIPPFTAFNLSKGYFVQS